MKQKHISIVERHVEKAVFGICLIVGAIAVFIYVLGRPYSVEVNGQDLTPAQVEERILSANDRLKSGLDRPDSPLGEVPIASYATDYQDRVYREPVRGLSRYEHPIGPPGLDPRLIEVEEVPLPHFMVATPPAPESLEWRVDFATLDLSRILRIDEPDPNADRFNQPEPDEEAVELANEIKQLIGEEEPPLDFWYVTVEAEFDMGEWRQLLAAAPEDERIPAPWAQARSLITAVVLERSRWNPQTGVWESPEEIGPLPTSEIQLRFRDAPPAANRLQADEWEQTIRIEQERLARPSFLPVLSSRAWMPPGAMNRINQEQLEELRRIEAEIAELTRSLRQPQAGQEAGPRAPTLDRPSQQPPPTRGRVPEATGAPNQQQGVFERLAALRARRAEIEGVQEERERVERISADPLERFNRVRVYAHDVTAKPGERYRYSMQVGVFNPLFHRDQLDEEQRRQYFDQLTLWSQPSEWTPTVVVPQEKQFFLVGSDPNSRTATIRVRHVFDAKWRDETFEVQPGDPIGRTVTIPLPRLATDVEADLSVGATAVDIDFEWPRPGGLRSTTTRLIYLDEQTGRLEDRTQLEDMDAYEGLAGGL